MAKRATYNVEFGFEGLSLIEQERFYEKLISILDQNMKDRLHVKVTDEEKHSIFVGMVVCAPLSFFDDDRFVPERLRSGFEYDKPSCYRQHCR